MSTSSVLGSMQSALNCAGKCDCCNKLQQQINALNQRVSALKTLTDGEVRQVVNNVVDQRLPPKIIEIENKLLGVETVAKTANTTAGSALSKASGFESTLAQMNAAIASALSTANTAQKTANGAATVANTADSTATSASGKATTAQGEARAAQVKANRSINVAEFAEAEAHNASGFAGTAVRTSNYAFDEARQASNNAFTADIKATNSIDIARKASLESELATGVANQADFKAGNAINRATTAESTATTAISKATAVEGTVTNVARTANTALNTANAADSAVGGLRGLVNGIGAKIDGFGRAIATLESKVGDALVKAAEAVGISKNALAATGKLAGQVLQIFNLIGTIFTILDGMATREVLGARIDAIEAGLIALGNSVSGILGKLLGLQNRIGRNEASISEVRGIAIDAKGIGEAAKLQAGAAQVTATRAENFGIVANANAKTAQTTADGAVRNASRANENATTAYNKANEAQGIGEQAKRIAGDALGKAGVALSTALTVIALYQGVRSLRGLQGIPGIPGRQGERGLQGIQGIQGLPGRDGITTVVQVPGVPGRDGRNGINGINGRNGRDVNPAETASLRALIIQQHTQTRLNSTSQHSATRTTILTPIMAALAPILALLKQIYDIVSKAASAAQLALLNIINNKLGNQVVGGISGLVTAVAENTYIEKVLSVLTFATTVHNALLLSSNLGQTLFMIIDQVTAFILPKGLDGTPINISNVLGKAVHEVIVSTVGEATAAEIQQKWDQTNRIYQAALNIHNQVLGLGGVLTAGLEVIGGNVGKIGNALRKGGVLLENAYSYMNPQPNLKGKFFQQMNLVGENLQAIALVTAIPIALAAAKDGVDSSVADLKREISQTDPTDAQGHPLHNADGTVIHYKPGLEVPDPVVVKAEGDQAKSDSTNFVELVIEDIFDGGD